jgi:NADPH2:quinone reductase
VKALCFDRFGGPAVLAIRELPDPVPEPGRVVVRTEAIGLNFADVYRRRGTYHLAGDPPYVLGYEGAGVVVAAGAGAEELVGARVAFADVPFANAELVSVPVDRLLALPDEIDTETAAAVVLQGLTAQYLLSDAFAVGAGTRVVVHAAAGGVGLLMVQMAKARGAVVVGLCSSEEKAGAVREAGADEVVVGRDDWVARVRAVPGFQDGADVVYDSVGQTLDESLSAARTGGVVAVFGTAGGEPPPVDVHRLIDESRTIDGGDLWNVLTDAESRRARSRSLFAAVADGSVRVRIAARIPLADGGSAHRLIESRMTTGKVLLIP